jgi:hypothetical protein
MMRTAFSTAGPRRDQHRRGTSTCVTYWPLGNRQSARSMTALPGLACSSILVGCRIAALERREQFG